MIDFSLARRFLIKIEKDILNAQLSTDRPEDVKKHLERAADEVRLMYDILHINELAQIDIIDLNRRS